MTGSKNKSKQRSKANNRALRSLADQNEMKSYVGSDNTILGHMKLIGNHAFASVELHNQDAVEFAENNQHSVTTFALLWAVYILAVVFDLRIITWAVDSVCDFIIKETVLLTTYWCINNIQTISDISIRLAEEFKEHMITEIRDQVFVRERAMYDEMKKAHLDKIVQMACEQKTMLHIIANLDEHLQELGRPGSGIDIARALVCVEKRSSVESIVDIVVEVGLGLGDE